jgi:hypothetical protein
LPPADPNKVSTAVAAGVTTASLLTAVRARDKAQLQNQANIAKEGLKKWGVNFVNRRRPNQLEDDGGAHAHHTSAYYAPSPEEREHHQHHAPRTSLQERLNAAAHAKAAAAKRDSSSTQSSIIHTVGSTESQDSLVSPASSTLFSPSGTPAKSTPSKGTPLPIMSAPRLHLPPHPSALQGTSPPAAAPAPAPRMVVPSVPKRAGVVTGIGHNPASTSADALDQVSASAKDKPEAVVRADSDPARVQSAPPDPELAAYQALTPQPAVTATSVTARTTAADGESPALQSLLGHVRSSSNSTSSGNSNGNSNGIGNEDV